MATSYFGILALSQIVKKALKTRIVQGLCSQGKPAKPGTQTPPNPQTTHSKSLTLDMKHRNSSGTRAPKTAQCAGSRHDCLKKAVLGPQEAQMALNVMCMSFCHSDGHFGIWVGSFFRGAPYLAVRKGVWKATHRGSRQARDIKHHVVKVQG